MSDQLPDEDWAATLERVAAYAEELRRADRQTDRTSLDRARDLRALYEDRRWVTDLPQPKNRVWRGRPVIPDSENRFATWLLQQQGMKPSMTGKLLRADRWLDRFIGTAVRIKPSGEYALRPLYRLERVFPPDAVPDVYAKAIEYADGQAPSYADTARAVREHLAQFTPRQVRHMTEREQGRQHANRAVREMAWLTEHGMYDLFNEAAERIDAIAAKVDAA